MDKEALKHAAALMDAAMQSMPKPDGVGEDWLYKDIPWVIDHYWDLLLDIIGPDNHLLLIHSERRFDDGLFLRGQMFISPAGIGNLKAWRESQ